MWDEVSKNTIKWIKLGDQERTTTAWVLGNLRLISRRFLSINAIVPSLVLLKVVHGSVISF